MTRGGSDWLFQRGLEFENSNVRLSTDSPISVSSSSRSQRGKHRPGGKFAESKALKKVDLVEVPLQLCIV